MGLSYQLAGLFSLAGRYDNRMLESTISPPQSGTKNSTTAHHTSTRSLVNIHSFPPTGLDVIFKNALYLFAIVDLIRQEEILSAWKHFGQPGGTLVSLEALCQTWKLFGQPESIQISIEELWLPGSSLGKPESTRINPKELWSFLEELWSAWKHFVRPGSSLVNLKALG
jgi:hypothetical protein